MRRFRLVTFDVTNTLLQFRSSVGQVYAQAGKMFGVDCNVSELNAHFKKNFKALLKEHPNFGAASGLSSENWWTQVVKRTFFDSSSKNASDKQLTLVAKHLYDAYGKNDFWMVTPGTHTLLQKLRDSDIFLGVISNSDDRLDGILKETELRKYFDFVLASYTVGHEKPSPKIFEMALRQAGVRAEDAVHVGDDFELDFLAARRAGWSSFLLSNKDCDHRSISENDIVKNITDLQRKIVC